jgi:hypothetical protein
MAVTVDRDFKQGAKAPQATEDARTMCLAGDRFDPFDQTVTGVDVDAGVAITERGLARGF